MPQCTDKTKAGKPCKRKAKNGHDLCASHLGATARPSKLHDVKDKLIEALELGNSRDGACAYAGVHPATFYRWLEHAEADEEQGVESEQRELRDAALRAEGFAEQSLVAEIRRAATGFVNPDTRKREGADWKAAAFLLERRHPGRWGRSDRVQVKHSGGVGSREPVEVPLDRDRLGEVAAILGATGALGEREAN